MNNEQTQERTLESVAIEQKQFVAEVATQVSTIISNSQLSLKGMRRVLNAHIDMDNKDKIQK